ncbi:MAG TPA: HDOD domain-containing protein [Spirochaetota bacterium]|nr:HDOD domain-containing protein [Spirochaetota bacterium]
MPQKIDKQKIKKVIHDGKPLVYSVNSITEENSTFFIKTVNEILKELKMEYMQNQLNYIIRELLFNADKSNLKRVHFDLNNLNINNKNDYKKGMKNFAASFRENLEKYQKELVKKKYYTRIVYFLKNKVLIIAVKNNNLPTKEEQEKINQKIAQSKKLNDISETYLLMQDADEGAGLGTITIMMMLRSLGIGDSAYTFKCDPEKEETISQVSIPLNSVTVEQAEEISRRIAEEIEYIPQFPDNIYKLQQMLSNKDIAFSEIAKIINRDPGLTAELLKIVNSAQYMLRSKVSNITNALSMIGVKGLKSLLYSYGTQKTLGAKYKRLDDLWEHAYRCASYAYNIARNFKKRKIVDDVYLGGILHDIGRIVVKELHPNLLKKINSYCVERNIESDFIEGLAVGVSHAQIGAMIAEKWNFPEHLVTSIRYHHTPQLAPDQYKDIVNIIYFANSLCAYREGRFNFIMADHEILGQFKITDEDELDDMEIEYNELYEKQKAK